MYYRLKRYANRGRFFLFFLRNWWVGVFITMALALYIQALYQKNHLVWLLARKVSILEKEKEKATQEKQQLLLRLKSQDDPEWTLLVLKQKLGVVEEGETKVIFSKRTS